VPETNSRRRGCANEVRGPKGSAPPVDVVSGLAFKGWSIDQLSNFPTSQKSTLNLPGPEQISQIKKST